MGVPRRTELRRRRKRRDKLIRLRRRYRESRSAEEKSRIQQKIAQISPTAKVD